MMKLIFAAKAFVLGFGEYEIKDDIAEVHLASDLKEYIDVFGSENEDRNLYKDGNICEQSRKIDAAILCDRIRRIIQNIQKNV